MTKYCIVLTGELAERELHVAEYDLSYIIEKYGNSNGARVLHDLPG